MIINRERSRFYRAEEFAHGMEDGHEVAGWVGYYVDRRSSTGRVYTVEEMFPISVGAFCEWTPQLAAQARGDV